MALPKRKAPGPNDWKPNAGPQTRFLSTMVDECLYGGAAGGGKSSALVMMPLRWVPNPDFRALILRREIPQLGKLWDESTKWYPKLGAEPNRTKLEWTFPSGARIWFTHCQHEDDVGRFDGLEFQYIGFDELTHFTEKQFTAICARIRASVPGLPRYARATTNPGGDGHEWVFKRWAPWLNPECATHAKPGERLWYVPRGGRWIDAEGREHRDDTNETFVPRGTIFRDDEYEKLLGRGRALEAVYHSRSRLFIPARLADNPHVDGGYRAQLMELDPVRRAQLIEGDWLIKPAAGAYFKRAWFDIVDAAPSNAVRIRYWDRAGTVDGDWTVGLRLARSLDDGLFFVEDVVRMRGTPGEVDAVIRQTADIDGPAVHVVVEQDPGQAGLDQANRTITELAGFVVGKEKPTGDKVTRAGHASSQAQAKNVKVVRGAWNKAFIEELESFPEGEFDDQVDGLSGAFNRLVRGAFNVQPSIGRFRGRLPKPRI